MNSKITEPKYYIGTAGWSYKDWVGPFYPKAQSASFDWLKFYAQYFNCVEVNSTYYTYVSPKIVEGLIKKVETENDFLFTLKLHQDFTHKKNFTSANINAVKESLNILNRQVKLGGLLIQFPYSFQFNDANAKHINSLSEIFCENNLFVEVRHKSWLKNEAMELFKNLNLTYCTIDQPQIGEAVPFQIYITNDKLYIRFHGRNVKAWKQSINNFGKEQSYDEQNERYNYLYTSGELTEIAQKIKSVHEKVKEVYIIMNNHPQGNAVANAFELMFLLGEKNKLRIPENLIKVHPILKTIYERN